MIKNKFRLISKNCTDKVVPSKDALVFSRCLCPFAPKRPQKMGYCKEKHCPKMVYVHPFVAWAKDHYWDSLQDYKDIIVQHIADNFK